MDALKELIEGASTGSSSHWRSVAGQAAAELARLQAIESAFFKIVSPDGFFQLGIYEECPVCQAEGAHEPDCKLAAALERRP